MIQQTRFPIIYNEMFVRRVIRKMRKTYKKVSFDIAYRQGKILSAKIKKAEALGSKVAVFKPETIEEVDMHKVYGFIVDGSFKVNYPEIDLWKFTDATVIGRTDFVFDKNGNVFWKKYFAYNYSKNITSDRLFLKEENGIVYYKKPKHFLNVDVAFSMLGVHAHIWSHSLSEYYPKLSVLQSAIDDAGGEITVLVPDYQDLQLKEVVYNELNKHKGIKILVVDDEVAVKVKFLYYMERPTTFTDHEVSVALGDDVQPKVVAEILKEKLVSPLLGEIDQNAKPIKIYLPRRGFGRNLINWAEVEEYFRENGYYFLEAPHKLSLKEKVQLFNSAEVIAGPFGSAFSNILFCKPGTKILLFSNFSRFYEAWLCLHKKYFNLDMLWVTGYDDKSAANPSHSSFYIPLQKIKDAAKYFGIV